MDYIVKAYKDWKLHSQFQEIVPDMDDEYMFNEKQSIRESGRSLKKYGSTTVCCNNHIRNNETLVRHVVEKTDTLQGIALKYGCTTEQIRRTNRLFASDSLFLRQFLLVPVDKTSPYFPAIRFDENCFTPQPPDENATLAATTLAAASRALGTAELTPSSSTTSSSATSTSTSANSPRASAALPTRPYSIAGELVLQTNGTDNAELSNHNYQHHNHVGVGGSGNAGKQSKSLDSVVAMTPEEENRKCINEFLSKIDTTISESRKYVEKSKEMIGQSQSDDDLFVASDIVQRRRNNQLNNSYKNNRVQHQHSQQSSSQAQSHHQRHSSTGSTSDTAQLLNTTQTRRVQNSLKRLEKQQDEFFEL